MDLLHQRYANPFPFLNEMIRSRRLLEFVEEFDRTVFEEKDEKALWEFYLHRVLDKSFADFKAELAVEQENRNMTETDIETTIKNSRNILANFNPEERGE